MISIIVAVSSNNVIGAERALPWHLPEDLQRFKKVTMGKPIIMGRETHASIGRPVPGRQNIVLSRQDDLEIEGCEVVNTIEAALAAAGDAEEVMIVGGGEIYRQFLPMSDRIYLTRVQAEVEGDTRFPELDMSEWDVTAVEEFPAIGDREFAFDIETLERRREDEVAAN